MNASSAAGAVEAAVPCCRSVRAVLLVARAHGAMLALAPSVDARALVMALTIAAFTTAARAEGANRPVFVTIVGQGVIRLRLAAGITAPCDSSENRMLFDGLIAPGRYRWDTGARHLLPAHVARSARLGVVGVAGDLHDVSGGAEGDPVLDGLTEAGAQPGGVSPPPRRRRASFAINRGSGVSDRVPSTADRDSNACRSRP